MSSCPMGPSMFTPRSVCEISSARSQGCLSIWQPMRSAILPTSVVAARNWLLDTGPVVGLLSRDDAAHRACAAAFESVRGHLLTTEAVLTEAMHLLGRRPDGGRAC